MGAMKSMKLRGVVMKRWIAIGALLCVAGCEPEDFSAWDGPLEPVGPVILEDGLAYLDPDFEEVIFVRPDLDDGEPRLSVERAFTGAGPAVMAASADGQMLYVLNEEGRSLSIFSTDEGEIHQRQVNVASAYDVITPDERGEFVLLSNSGQEREERVVQNVNEVGIVDLRGEEPQASFMSLPARARQLIFMPPFEIDGQEQRLVVALARSEVMLLDLQVESGPDQWRRVPLTLSQGDGALNPVQVEFDIRQGSEGSDVARIYVLIDGGNDVPEITIQAPIEQGAAQDRKLALSVNSLAAGQRPGAIVMLDLPQGRRLLALERSQPNFTLVDIMSAESATFSLPMSVPATDLRVFDGFNSEEERTERKVLVYSPSSRVAAVIRPEAIALGSETPTLGQTVRALAMEALPRAVRMDESPGAERAIVLHGGSNEGFTILDLRNHSVISLKGEVLSDVVFDGERAYGVFGSSPHLVRIDLRTGHAPVFDLPARVEELYFSPEKELLMVSHPGKAGRFTVLPLSSPRAESARLFEHMFLDGVLDRRPRGWRN